ncbi:hypothetical protein [Paraburkholderia lacunae]|uniref:hypothetical protein n=1 Tax=Paraburkholderia lacunae TaxID=2211104 RepID=UPI0014032C3E|nr:hypothetical protein [Paraburkholderia lacunae]
MQLCTPASGPPGVRNCAAKSGSSVGHVIVLPAAAPTGLPGLICDSFVVPADYADKYRCIAALCRGVFVEWQADFCPRILIRKRGFHSRFNALRKCSKAGGFVSRDE